MVVDVSLLIAKSSLIREESRGVHIREDYPDESDEWKTRTVHKNGNEPLFVGV